MPSCPLCGKSYEGEWAYCPECRTGQAQEGAAEKDAAAQVDALELEVLELLVAGEKLAAIKLYRERTGASLAEAKRAVENIESPPKPVDSDLEARVVALLRQKSKIAAIKLYREQTHCGLKEAKDAVEEMQRKHGIAGTVGCAGVLLVAIVGGAALLAWG